MIPRRVRRSPGEHAEQAPSIAPRLSPHDRVLALQRTAGNAAVAKLMRKDPEPPRAGGWNEKSEEVAGTLRIPLTGVAGGNSKEDVRGDSKEGAAGKAIAIVPDGADVGAKPDVLLFFHGMGNLGYRERTTDHKTRGPAGSVHDVEADRMEQQLSSSKRNIIGLLPQGTNDAEFGIADPQKYVDDALKLVRDQLAAAKPAMKLPDKIEAGRIIVSGHSGGGRAAVGAVTKLTQTAPKDDAAWVKAPPLFLFDGINGPNETNAMGDLMDKWLDADLAWLKAAKDPLDLLKRRGIKLRSTHSNSDLYTATNLGGSYMGGKDNDVKVTIAPEKCLKGRIDHWFKVHEGDLKTFGTDLRKQYDVPDAAVAGQHESTVGTGSLETDKSKRDPAPSGMTGASKDAGVPDSSGGGHLQDSLDRLPKDAMIPQPPPPPKHAEAEEAEEEEKMYA